MDDREWWSTYDTLQRHAASMGFVEGCPMPLDDLPLTIYQGHPLKKEIEAFGSIKRGIDRDDGGPELPPCTVRNTWWSRRYRQTVYIIESEGKVQLIRDYNGHDLNWIESLNRVVFSMMAAQAWKLDAEFKAIVKLHELLSPKQAEIYGMTGSFIETSRRSGVTYIFRRLRPTIALRKNEARGTTHWLCALCLHPLGYYRESHAGAMVPTDDVIAHLLLMRGDEHLFWRRANQHPLWHPLAGV